jgi:hypothetical protein
MTSSRAPDTLPPGNGLPVEAEYHYSGFGAASAAGIVPLLTDPAFQERYLRGDTQILGRHAVAVLGSYECGPRLAATGEWLLNPIQRSRLDGVERLRAVRPRALGGDARQRVRGLAARAVRAGPGVSLTGCARRASLPLSGAAGCAGVHQAAYRALSIRREDRFGSIDAHTVPSGSQRMINRPPAWAPAISRR